ncbi:myosin light chain kinase, smooth muscle-like isoform X3 [Mugil cephalus]|uniref:myosin light chain kinase, smooth muscle-like isoform X3 n=1 Tax=Mugil cephalus TaxID=48193 RepID=UPI001FB77CF1|nr:myosin light chain kinase, smooth muscle-like isoform X3 [Mugil cephalus]
MVMMFSQNQAALLLIVLLAHRVFADILVTDHRDMLVSRGDSVTFHCNVSTENASEITWNFKRFIYKHSVLINQTFSNVSSHRLKIDLLKLNIFSAQPEDAGLYSCSVTSRRGLNSVSWNLTVSEDIEVADMLISRGDSVRFHCNVSTENASEITWNFKRFIYKHSVLINQTFSNVSSHRLKIDLLKLNIFSAQPEDAGLYSCSVTSRRGLNSVSWNLTVSEDIEEISSSWYLLYVLTPTTLLLLCGIVSAVCLWGRCRARTPNSTLYESRILSQAQYQVILGGEVAPPQPYRRAVYRTIMNSERLL